MGNYRTCHNCAIDKPTCERLATVKTAVAKLGVTSIKFKCDLRTPLYMPGDRVVVTWFHSDEYGDTYEECWPATVIKEVASRFLIKVDDVESGGTGLARADFMQGGQYAKVSAQKLRRLDEPKRTPCVLCGEVKEDGLDACWQKGGTVKHRLCLAATLEREVGTWVR